MPKEETKNFSLNLINPFYKGVCKMKLNRHVLMIAHSLKMGMDQLIRSYFSIAGWILGSHRFYPLIGFVKIRITQVTRETTNHFHLNRLFQILPPKVLKLPTFMVNTRGNQHRRNLWLLWPVGLTLLIGLCITWQERALPNLIPLMFIAFAGIIRTPETEHLEEQTAEKESKKRAHPLIKDRIIHFRRVNRLTQKELAKALGITAAYVSQLENGATPSYKLCRKLAEVLGIDENLLRIQAFEESESISILTFITTGGDEIKVMEEEVEFIKYLREHPEWKKTLMELVKKATKEYINVQKDKTKNEGVP